MKYEERKSSEYINNIIEHLIKDDRLVKVQRKIEREIELHQDSHLLARKVLANARFEHSKENIDKLLLLNKRLHELQDECAKLILHRDLHCL